MARTTKKEDESLKRMTVGVLIASIFGVLFLLWYVANDMRPFRRSRRTAPTDQPMIVSPPSQSLTREMLRGGAPTVFTPGIGYQQMMPVRMPQGIPRYFANLSTTVEGYIVSVRQVADFDQGMTIYDHDPSKETHPSLNRVSLSIQVMANSTEAMTQVRDFAAHLKVTDNKGGKQDSIQPSRIAEFDRGKARLIVMNPPSKEAEYYTTVEGTLLLRNEDKSQREIPFTLPNVPLPSRNHLFGLASANLLTLSSEQSQFDAEGKGMIQGEPAHAFEKKFPPFTPETGLLKLPNRLILVTGIANRFPMALPTPQGELPLMCTLTYHTEPESYHQMTVRLEAVGNPAKPLEWQFDAYENEPIILTFAPSHFGLNSPQTAGVRLLMFTRPITETLPTISPFRGDPKTKSGTLLVTAQVRNYPLRSGRVRIEIVYRMGDKIQSGEAIVNLNEAGIGRVNNLPPGNYEVTLKELMPHHNTFTPQPDAMQALMRRYRINQPKLTEQVQKSLTLAPGGQITLKPWRVIESGVAANQASHSSP